MVEDNKLNQKVVVKILEKLGCRTIVAENGKEALTVADWIPTVDISETDSEYHIKAELPDVRKEDVKVSVENGVLTIRGERHQEKERRRKSFHGWSEVRIADHRGRLRPRQGAGMIILCQFAGAAPVGPPVLPGRSADRTDRWTPAGPERGAAAPA